ncbi:unnamed protein product [Durusdinium trenchii]|uniref:Protein kinase domain-containing protein n=1 Tax=Durusdinium trenchii TaxID=1381693 RepID=A0ABP0PS71_9DINO
MGTGASVGNVMGAFRMASMSKAVSSFSRWNNARNEQPDSELIKAQVEAPLTIIDLTGIENPGYIADVYIFADGLIGRSVCSMTRQSTHKQLGVSRAIKQYILGMPSVDIEALKREVMLLKDVRAHPNIVRMHETFKDKLHFYVVFELCEGLRVFDYIMDAETHTEQETANVVQQVVAGVDYMHSRLICHRDIKPEHVLLKEKGSLTNCQAKIIDFKTASEFVAPGYVFTERAGTPYYCSPQVYQGRYTESCDLWTCGVLAYLMLIGYPEADQRQLESKGPTRGKDVLELLPYRLEFSPSDWADLSPGVNQFLSRLLADRETDRWPAKAAAKSEWLMRQAPQPLGTRVQVAGDAIGLEKLRTSQFAEVLSQRYLGNGSGCQVLGVGRRMSTRRSSFPQRCKRRSTSRSETEARAQSSVLGARAVVAPVFVRRMGAFWISSNQW